MLDGDGHLQPMSNTQPHHGASHERNHDMATAHITRMRDHPNRNAAHTVREELNALQQRRTKQQQEESK